MSMDPVFKKFNHFPIMTKYKVRFTNILDVSNVIIIPNNPQAVTGIEDRMIFTCMFYHPDIGKFSEAMGIKVKLQDVFYNIKENRNLAWVCVEFFKLLFMKLNPNMEMRIMGRTYNSELIVRLYTKDFETMRLFSNIYTNHSDEYFNQYIKMYNYQKTNFDELCINDFLALYSKYTLEKKKSLMTERKLMDAIDEIYEDEN